MAEREEGAAAPNQRQGQNQQQNQQQQQNPRTSGTATATFTHKLVRFLSQNSQGNQKKMQRHIYYAPMTG